MNLYLRSSELLDALGLADELAQECFACRGTVSYDANLVEVLGQAWSFMWNMKDTPWKFALVLGQKYQEEIFQRGLKELGVGLETLVELNSTVDDSFNQSRGGGSALKKRSYISTWFESMEGGCSFDELWRVYGAFESPTHGNVLWAAMDHGVSRIGPAFIAGRRKAYLEFNKEAAVAEPIASVRPFNLEFKHVGWWTIYSRFLAMQLLLHRQDDPDADPTEVLDIAMEEAASFTSGLSIAFDYKILNSRNL
ncbi:3-(3-hydroxy-phenyl)propionate hydroxylase [Drepanopeziza brunnea f. sp. 'multigermtubi' MB_m1]|uniref:3-(3-hydroxy-phenyl)propionate hydroxylase n=1 Tax=Marssonina brunnea f. sp. multigermtubi (strain MB_m1) TaxID=1072389 RepID=K1XHC1_MARBU|nr:3-(3-hydroxy-phenyl)propionate hydroxylase [Drepanopeziza brunnea f. sp. 'multigermtubi' MB_m1]EKD11879.1 3-(3-hydroxy-phenyl)propionate hydroxylase [Drepanopeziza brunnea f. sp. 'multigermtubi' MB_m1]